MKQLFTTTVLSAFVLLGCTSKTEMESAEQSERAPISLSPEMLAEGKVLFTKCASCHGHNAEGIKAFNSPALANQEKWYLRKQLDHFLNGRRGAHLNDSLGAQMIEAVRELESEDQIETVIAYIKLLPPVKTDQTVFGNEENGKHNYNELCASCHGIDAKGIEAYLSPNLLGIQDYYMAAQLRNFRDGVRSVAEGDTVGARMIETLAKVPDDRTIDDIITYVHTLQTNRPKYY